MRPTKVAFHRTVNLGNDENVRLMVEVEIEPGEGAAAAMDAARRFIQRESRKHDPNRQEDVRQWQQMRQRYRTVVANPMDYSPREQQTAQEWLDANPTAPSDSDDDDPIL